MRIAMPLQSSEVVDAKAASLDGSVASGDRACQAGCALAVSATSERIAISMPT